ncbi:MAG TPA: DUF805 domain-containing protein [Steroidobacteraceae bacterium]|nr:DUF805 domain-containing protein [Steroidobacteraceae bacterium]
MRQLVFVGRLIFGAWMLANGAGYFFSLWPLPSGHEPLAIQLLAALVHSRLLDVVMAIELITGALILAGFFVPVALCVVMPVSTCALYWVLLNHQPLSAILGLAGFALNGFLMLAYLEYYRGALQRHALMVGESPAGRMSWDSLFVNLNGRTSRGQFAAALITFLAVVALYVYLAVGPTGRNAQWCLLALLFPGIILHARRLHDMGHTAWLLLVPGGLMVVAFAIWLRFLSLGVQLDAAVPLLAIVVAAGFALWGCMGRGQVDANSYGTPLAN